MKQIEIAEKLGMSQGHLSDILSGKRPVGKDIAKKLEAAVGIRWVEFLDMDCKQVQSILDKHRWC